jgi:hypothetical protein
MSLLDQLLAAMAFIADAPACEARLDQLRQASKEAADFAASAQTLREEIAKERRVLKAERDAQAKQLIADRDANNTRLSQWEAELQARDRKSKQLSEAAAAARDRAEQMKADIERRLKKVIEAAA